MSFTPPSSYSDTSGGSASWTATPLTYQSSHANATADKFYYHWWSGGFEIYYDKSTQKWHDPNTTHEPHYLTSTNSSTQSSDSGVVVNGDTVYLWGNNNVLLFQFTMSGGVDPSSGGPGGGGPNPLSNNNGETPKVFRNFW